jgi:preprotein translocase subunit SecD
VLLRDNRVRYESVERRPDGSIVATLAAGADVGAAQALVAKNLSNLTNDVQGNTIVVRVPDRELQQITTDAIEQNVGTLRNRINELGVAECGVSRCSNTAVSNTSRSLSWCCSARCMRCPMYSRRILRYRSPPTAVPRSTQR